MFAALGLDQGEAHILRNAGGVITNDVIRSLAISQRKLGKSFIEAAKASADAYDRGRQTGTEEDSHAGTLDALNQAAASVQAPAPAPAPVDDGGVF